MGDRVGEPTDSVMRMAQLFYVETLGCPKNDVDSDKLVGALLADGMLPTTEAANADLVVVNTCAFIDDARRESIDTILALDEQRRDGSKLVVTGCMAERYGDELAADVGVPLLGRIPIEATVADGGDNGDPVVLRDGPAAEAFRDIVRTIVDEAVPPAEMAGCSARLDGPFEANVAVDLPGMI